VRSVANRETVPWRLLLGGAREVAIGNGITDCLQAMAPYRRQAVALHLVGHSVPETAGLLSCTRKRAENLVYRGLADLRACLRKKELEP
jgi:RNA polymerase sigma-70 factor (ECF subfamily)